MSLTWAPQVSMSKEEIDNFLNLKLVARLSSNRADGYPHASPFWYHWDGDALWIMLGSGERPRQHIKNLRRDPKLCVVIDRDVRPEQGGFFGAEAVIIRGKAELSTDEKLQEWVATNIMGRYFGKESVTPDTVTKSLEDSKPGKNRVILKVKPEKIYAWDFHKLEDSSYKGYTSE